MIRRIKSHHNIDEPIEARLQLWRHHEDIAGKKFSGRAEVAGETGIRRQNAKHQFYVALVVVFVVSQAAKVREPGVGARAAQRHYVDERRVGDLTHQDLQAGLHITPDLERNVAHQTIDVVCRVDPDVVRQFVRFGKPGEAGQLRLVRYELRAVD